MSDCRPKAEPVQEMEFVLLWRRREEKTSHKFFFQNTKSYLERERERETEFIERWEVLLLNRGNTSRLFHSRRFGRRSRRTSHVLSTVGWGQIRIKQVCNGFVSRLISTFQTWCDEGFKKTFLTIKVNVGKLKESHEAWFQLFYTALPAGVTHIWTPPAASTIP